MAVVNAFTAEETTLGGGTDTGTGVLLDANSQGKLVSGIAKAVIAAADDDASVYRLTKVRSSWVPFDITIQTSAISGGTDYDLGLYNPTVGSTTGTVVDKDILLDGQTMASASTTLNGLGSVPAVSRGQPLWKILGLTTDPQKTYDLALTANTVGGQAGNIAVSYQFLTNG